VIRGALYVALIYLQPGQQDALRRYESLALPVFRRHGGRFERILSPARVAGSGDARAGSAPARDRPAGAAAAGRRRAARGVLQAGL